MPARAELTRLIAAARADIGRTDAAAYRARPWHRNWCAAAVCSWLRRAGLEAPERPARAARGAKALGRWLGERHGYRLVPGFDARQLERCLPEPGDVIVWHRGAPGSWTGHVVLIVAVHTDGSIETVGGNERGRRGVQAPAVRLRRLARDGWTRRLCCIAKAC